MRFKQKIAYMALGGALVFAGMLLAAVLTNTAQSQGASNGNFNTVTARKLKIVDAVGNVLVELGEGSRTYGGGGYLWIYDNKRRVQAAVGVDKKGGYVDINDKSGSYGKRSMILHVGDQGGRVDLYRSNGKPAAFVGSAGDGGVFVTYNLSGDRASAVGVDRNGKGVLVGYIATSPSR